MKKLRWTMIVMLIAVMAMTGCGNDDSGQGAGEEPVNEAVYAQQIENYVEAFTQQWDEGKYMEAGMSPVAAYYYEGTALDNAGYALVDLDSDGSDELLIGAIANSENDPIVFEAWTLTDGQPENLLVSHSRNRYYLEKTEDGVYIIANEAHNGAANMAYHYYTFEDGKFRVMEGIMLDAAADSENPWFMTSDDNWDASDDEPIDEETAMEIVDAHISKYMVPEYKAFSQYK